MTEGRGLRDYDHDCRIFVGGLSPQTTTETMWEYFSEYGKLLDCIVMVDAATRKSRRFGFVTYENAEQMEYVLAIQIHSIDGKEVDCKKARPPVANINSKANMNNNKEHNYLTEKIFVGGVPDLCTDKFREHFEQFGNVVGAVLINDKVTGKPRGFGFITYDNVDSVKDVIENVAAHQLHGKPVLVKKAFPKDRSSEGGRRAGGGFGGVYSGGGTYDDEADYYGAYNDNTQMGSGSSGVSYDRHWNGRRADGLSIAVSACRTTPYVKCGSDSAVNGGRRSAENDTFYGNNGGGGGFYPAKGGVGGTAATYARTMNGYGGGSTASSSESYRCNRRGVYAAGVSVYSSYSGDNEVLNEGAYDDVDDDVADTRPCYNGCGGGGCSTYMPYRGRSIKTTLSGLGGYNSNVSPPSYYHHSGARGAALDVQVHAQYCPVTTTDTRPSYTPPVRLGPSPNRSPEDLRYHYTTPSVKSPPALGGYTDALQIRRMPAKTTFRAVPY